ncbi:cytochrome b [Humitalea rosea]|uniref:Cytochrome b n=1 Tax=Humitalea rosea TaxID=990373 RepID=A0A2W7IZP1_9PROT|nr:cytochrome b/b6 domain-containing protein [Humitalea rosea]PZW44837.1 cytochrome b [Humitalea rosea]
MSDGASGTTAGMTRIRVWDPWVRLVHWSLVGLVALSWWTAETGRMALHITSGLIILALVVFRILWGLVGSENARFAHFLRSPKLALAHLRAWREREPDHETTHNAAGGWMVIAILGLLLIQAVTGLFSKDEVLARGPLARRVSDGVSDLLSDVHGATFNLVLAVVALHVVAVVAYRVLKGQDLVRPMITGIKRLPAAYAASAPRLAPAWLGAVLLALAAALSVWVSRLG